MTEAEALTKWCPEARVSLYHRATDANRMVRYGSGEGSEDFQEFLAQTRCLGSGCMAWRWRTEPLNPAIQGSPALLAGDGYCGKAGKP